MSKWSKQITITTVLLIILFSGFPHVSATFEEPNRSAAIPEPTRRLTVGIYDNSPKVFMGENGTFAELLEALESGSIDILPDTAYTTSRNNRFAFSTVNIIDSWLQVFTAIDANAVGAEILTIQDLHKTVIGVLDGSRQQAFLQDDFRELYDIDCSLRSFATYAETQQALLAGSVDTMVVSRFFEFAPSRDARVVATGILFSPSISLYAFRSGIPAEFSNALDYHISQLQNQSGSLYYESLQHWLPPPTKSCRASLFGHLPPSALWCSYCSLWFHISGARSNAATASWQPPQVACMKASATTRKSSMPAPMRFSLSIPRAEEFWI